MRIFTNPRNQWPGKANRKTAYCFPVCEFLSNVHGDDLPRCFLREANSCKQIIKVVHVKTSSFAGFHL